MLSTKNLLQIGRLKVKGWKWVYYVNINQRMRQSCNINISYCRDFRAKKITNDIEGHYTMIKGEIHKDDMAIINVYASNNRVTKYVKQNQ